jgi:hypothetical protein
LKKAYNRLLTHEGEIEACKSFGDLLKLIELYTADICGFGKLAVYDTACRIGVYLGLSPEVVYLHAGTTESAKPIRASCCCEEAPSGR